MWFVVPVHEENPLCKPALAEVKRLAEAVQSVDADEERDGGNR